MSRLPIALFGIFVLSCATAEQSPGARGSGRLAPPPAVTCDRNQLTSWTGEITGYRRAKNSTWLQVSTDEGTVEQTTLEYEGQPDASARYLFWGEPFTVDDLALIEHPPGVLIKGMRATVWVCEDGVTPPLVDWQPTRD